MRTVVCVGAGPSLDKEQADAIGELWVNGAIVIAVNRAYEMVPLCNIVYVADGKACEAWALDIRKATADSAIIFTTSNYRDAVRLIGGNGPGLNLSPGVVNYGGSGGYQAINLAYHLGAEKIILAGYDYQHTDGKTHFHGDHPEGWANFGSPEERGGSFHRLAEDLWWRGVEVINCSKATSLTCFKRGTL